MVEINIKTTVIVLLFAGWYIYFVVRKAALHKIDFYDVMMLSTVAVIPAFFVVFPDVTYVLAKITGVAYPFVIMFGMLLALLFIFIHRLTRRLHYIENNNRLLFQEISLLRQSCESNNIKMASENKL